MNTKAFKKSVLLFFCLLSLSCLSVRSQQVIVGSNNLIETYRVSWWNMPISFGLSGNWARAMVGVIDIDNGFTGCPRVLKFPDPDVSVADFIIMILQH